ncbi:MAG: CCA tRNA nucleotidyltransferase [Planctomycetota bacterium]
MPRDAAIQIIRRLREHGHIAYLAGGCVRDRLLGREPKDHDVATDATPDVVQKLFRRSQPVGEAFGVVLVYPERRDRGAKNSGGVEVATFRTEGVYSDGRRPDDVHFSDAEHDAQRRDFTVNGLFEDPLHNRSPNPHADHDGVIDYVGGRADLQNHTLRAIGNPARRFAEDYLRMLRAVRFTARLGFKLDPATADAVRANAASLDQIARERIGDEVRATLTGPSPHLAARLLQQLRLDAPTLREAAQDPMLPTLERLALDAGYPAALAAWMFDRHADAVGPPQPADVARWRSALCLTNDETETLGRVLRHVRSAGEWPALGVTPRKRLLAARDWDAALAVLRALGRAESIEADTPALHDDGVGLAPAPLIDGGDLIRLGLEPGPAFKTLLDDAYDLQLEGRFTTRDQALDWVQQQHP